MSEPTYRVELRHMPEQTAMNGYPWRAILVRASDGFGLETFWGNTHEQAFDLAQSWVRAKALPRQSAGPVYLSEDGDILDPHEVQR